MSFSFSSYLCAQIKKLDLIQIGKLNTLEIVKKVDFGLYLDGGPYGELLLPKKYVPEGKVSGDDIEVFVYSDSEDRLITTTQKPLAYANEFGVMEVKEVGEYGVFLEWGIDGKDLLVPFREQRKPMEVGKKYVVYVYLDEVTDRIVASTKLNKFLKERSDTLEANQEVEIIIVAPSDLGYRVIVNQEYWGMLYKNEVFGKLEIGAYRKAFIKKIRPDHRIDVSLQKQGIKEIDRATQQLLEALEANEGFLPLTDKSPPEFIYEQLRMSKKNFKKAVGNLYKKRIIRLEKEGIRML